MRKLNKLLFSHDVGGFEDQLESHMDKSLHEKLGFDLNLGEDKSLG